MKKEKNNFEEICKIVIDFLIRIEEFDFLFEGIVNIFKERNTLNQIFLFLEEYIENEKFKYMFFLKF